MPPVTPTEGPVAVTGASGFVGSHVVDALVQRGYVVHACVTDLANPAKTAHLTALNNAGHSGRVELYEANLLEEASYDAAFAGCCAILHAGTAMAYGGGNTPRQVYEGAVDGTRNVLGSVRRAGSISRFVYTSSLAAIVHHMKPGYVFTEADWASDGRENDPLWDRERVDEMGEDAYAMAKVDTEHLVYAAAADDGFDAMSVNPAMVLGPLLSSAHELVFSWQWTVGRMLAGKTAAVGWQHLWNIVDVRDVAEAQALILEDPETVNGARYMLAASDDAAILDVVGLQAHLRSLFPDIDVGGGPPQMHAMIEKHGQVYDAPRGHRDRARTELGLGGHAIEDTLRETARTLIELGLVEPAFR